MTRHTETSSSSVVTALEEQVDKLVSKYHSIREPCAIVFDIFRNEKDHDLFIDVVSQHVMLIKSRSQAWEDGHITVWDKALLLLSKNGEDVGHLGALELYIEEFIGVNADGGGYGVGDLVAKHIAAKSLIGQRSRAIEVQHTCPKDSQSTPSTGKEEHADVSQGSIPATSPASTLHKAHDYLRDRKLDRILDIYFKAKKDFFDLDKSDATAKYEAARFLRDTAENTLSYLHTRRLKHHMIPELEDMFKHAKEEATELSGGKKRRFEIYEGQVKRPRYPNRYRGSPWSYRPRY